MGAISNEAQRRALSKRLEKLMIETYFSMQATGDGMVLLSLQQKVSMAAAAEIMQIMQKEGS